MPFTGLNIGRGIVAPAAFGMAGLNLGGPTLKGPWFINQFNVIAPSYNIADITKIDADGYPVDTLSNTINYNSGTAGPQAATVYKLAWPATRTFSLRITGNETLVLSSGATVTGGANNNMTVVTVAASAGWVTFTTIDPIWTIRFNVGAFYAPGSGNIALYRLSDEADYLAGEYFTPEFIAMLRDLKPRWLRTLGWDNVYNETRWAYRTRTANFSWMSNRYVASAWGGTTSGTDTYTASGAPDTPVVWTDQEVWIGVVGNANTTTTPSIDIAGRGPKTIIGGNMVAPGIGTITANSVHTFIYDAYLDQLIMFDGLWEGSIPTEATIQLCNRVGAGLWPVLPMMADDDYITNYATVVRDNLRSDVFWFPELSNETWNFTFDQTDFCSKKGQTFGWSTGSSQAVFGYYSVRLRQIHGNLIPAVFTGGSMSRVRRVMGYQGGGDTTNYTNRFEGAQLTPGNANYNAFTGSANYSVAPNRPIDVCELVAYAPYVGGTQLCFGDDTNPTYTLTVAANKVWYQALVDAWDTGDTTTAYDMISEDIRTGRLLKQTVTASGTTFTTPLAHGYVVGDRIWFSVAGGTIYSGLSEYKLYRVQATPTSTTFTMRQYVGNVGTGGSDVNAGSAGTGTMTVGPTFRNLIGVQTFELFSEIIAGMYTKDVECYEGNLEPVGPSAAQCTTLGLTGVNPSASVAAAITGWKNDDRAKQTQLDYMKQVVGTDPGNPITFGQMPNAKAPAQLTIVAGSIKNGVYQWALVPGDYASVTPYKTYDGFKEFSRA